MRVVHFACVAPPEIGGIGQVASREVVGLRGRGVDARLVAPEPAALISVQDHERSFITRAKPWVRVGNGAILRGMEGLMKGADLIHVHYPFYGAAELLLGGFSHHPPVVMTFHMDARPSGWRGWVAALHRFFVQPVLFAHAKKIIVSSLDYVQHSSLRSFAARHPERIAELPFGVDTDFYSPGPSVRARFGVPDGSRMILFVGGLDRAHAFKGIPELLRALTLIDASIQLVVIGDGDQRSAYEEETGKLGLRSRVHFLGRVDDETVRDAYRSADILAFPSTSGAEAFGLVAVEAQACGVPVVASSWPGVRTVVRQNETGLLVPPGNVEALASALKQILDHPDQRAQMSARAREQALARFSWDTHLDGLEKIYREVCASPS